MKYKLFMCYVLLRHGLLRDCMHKLNAPVKSDIKLGIKRTTEL